ncbi:MAG: thioredoxin [Xanthomonadales bacterium]|nr:thioredoxin [Xanthomonadales bacterium]
MSKVKTINEKDFGSEVGQSETPVLVDFYADWCGPCKAVAPVVEDLATAYDERLAVRKVNVDDNPALATRFGVRTIPTLLLFKDGAPVETIIGAVPRSRLDDAVKRHLN